MNPPERGWGRGGDIKLEGKRKWKARKKIRGIKEKRTEREKEEDGKAKMKM